MDNRRQVGGWRYIQPFRIAESRYQAFPMATRTSAPVRSSAVTLPGAGTTLASHSADAGVASASHDASATHHGNIAVLGL